LLTSTSIRAFRSLQTPLGPALTTRFTIKPTCLAKGPAHPPLATRPVDLRGNEASGQRHPTYMHTSILHASRQTPTYAYPYTHPSRTYCTSATFSPLWPPPPCQLPTRTTYIDTYTHTDADSHIPRTGYTRAHTIPHGLIVSTAAAATGAVHLASVSAVLVLHLGLGQLLFLNLFRFRCLLRRARAVYFNFFLIPSSPSQFLLGFIILDPTSVTP
jgi:hypothetical protein